MVVDDDDDDEEDEEDDDDGDEEDEEDDEDDIVGKWTNVGGRNGRMERLWYAPTSFIGWQVLRGGGTTSVVCSVMKIKATTLFQPPIHSPSLFFVADQLAWTRSRQD